MARVINFIRRSEAEFVVEEEIEPGQWLGVGRIGPAVRELAPRILGAFGLLDPIAAARALGSIFERKQLRVGVTELPALGAPPAGPLFEPAAPPPRAIVQGPLPARRSLGVTPEQITRLVTETKIREQQIKNYLATPLGWVFQESKQLPGTVVRVPVRRPTPPAREIEELFPLPTIPTAQELAGFGPAPVRVFKGWLQVEGQPRINVWEDFQGNEVQGFREVPGEFGQVEQILEF